MIPPIPPRAHYNSPSITKRARRVADLTLIAFRSMLRGGSGSDLPSSEAGQRNWEAGRRGIAWGPGSARVGPGGDAAPALAGAALRRPGRGAATRLLQLRSGAAPELARFSARVAP